MDFTLDLHRYEQAHRKKYNVLYHALRDAIRSGKLKRGDKLPSSRGLAELYEVSRGTATLVYEMLWSDGYVESEQGAGTYVAFENPQAKTSAQKNAKPRLSSWGEKLPKRARELNEPETKLNFRVRVPSNDDFPLREWSWSMRQAMRDLNYLLLDSQTPPEGLPELREGIAAHLCRARGMSVTPEEVIIVNGSVQAITLAFQLLIEENDSVVLEDPCFVGAAAAVDACGAKLISAPVDEEGIIVKNWNSPLAMVTPGHQFPTGYVMSRERRLELLNWAQQRNSFILEDDYDSDFRRYGRPIEPLKVLDNNDRVIYAGTFSRSLSHALRLGYVILPESLHERFVNAKQLYETNSSALLEQMTVANFMKHGYYERHVKRGAKLYAEKYEFLAKLIDEKLPGAFSWTDAEVGTHLFGWWNGSLKTLEEFERRAAKKGVSWSSPELNFRGKKRAGSYFGFAHLTEREMRKAVGLMQKAL